MQPWSEDREEGETMLRRWAWMGLVLFPVLLLAGEPPAPPAPVLPAPLPTRPEDRPRDPGNAAPGSGAIEPAPTILPAPRPLPTDPPPPDLPLETDQLRKEREALKAERGEISSELRDLEPTASAEEVQLRVKLAELHARLKAYEARPKTMPPTERQPTTPSKMAPPAPHAETPVLPPPGAEVGKPGDPFTLAQALFRAGEHAAALQNYRRIDPEGLTPQEKVLIQYMTACCLRKLGKLEEAAALYREVANAREDEVLTDCALWQLNIINGRREMSRTLEELRRRREAIK